jgi:hypothetical protein
MRGDQGHRDDAVPNTLFGSAIDITACHSYILSRQTPQRGFSFYRYGP